ncbi:MAG: hypothetical protein HOG33_00180 [Candidatus Marinimicrobia bacterium]|jgi:uncharacterized protein involved in high-affinity Fe2+ transport|nr:hypothetical protein [Candidatus Neomarinimicrobiota bacterium]MBT3796191.1 hypothetical protein [Candidatus Neomarinimicrobiota bacterium]MBT4318698.1 hypothetical protein [Candidatus Neomarinimicrobiota bacterium]MBT5097463.1 hypothetical protein [Candidatus Neomarinimicrobiota bacterium]MBT7422650.1 hypothetical protein [Candidatus Neomarinimicrobiota bacterium]|tara:strand:+ start:2018 stop:2560 length:543 start_codon:yes stop_codon:yes gene_type:complete
MLFNLLVYSLFFFNFPITNPELIIGKERVNPGIVFIFEGAIKDQIIPNALHLDEEETNVHIEARVNWDNKDIPRGTPAGGFIPYLNITATVTNESSGFKTFVDLKPHINLVDNLHYARNISLPGSINDLYSVQFNIIQPTKVDLALHRDWLNEFGEQFISNQIFNYNSINFKEIAQASRD